MASLKQRLRWAALHCTVLYVLDILCACSSTDSSDSMGWS